MSLNFFGHSSITLNLNGSRYEYQCHSLKKVFSRKNIITSLAYWHLNSKARFTIGCYKLFLKGLNVLIFVQKVKILSISYLLNYNLLLVQTVITTPIRIKQNTYET